MTVARPFRHLCPEADYRDSLSDADFWAHVYPDASDPDPSDYDAPPGMGVVVISDHVSPCPLCGEWGACGYDPEGRPMIHAFYDDLEDDR